MPTVLIVDDDKFTRTVLQAAFADNVAFSKLNIETCTADDGAHGLTQFLKHQPDVVITDLLMPNVDGWELCRAIRSEPSGKRVHLIAISGITRDTSVAQRLRNELDAAFFAKPYQMREMAQHIATLLSTDASGEDSQPIAVPRLPRANKESSGSLAERSLPAVLLDFLEAKATGHLTLKRGRITKVVELVVGHPFSVSSTARDETLGYFLVAFGVITADQHMRAVKRAAAKKERVSNALVTLGYVSPEDMVACLTMHTCYRLTQSLRWPDGSWSFQPKETPPGSRARQPHRYGRADSAGTQAHRLHGRGSRSRGTGRQSTTGLEPARPNSPARGSPVSQPPLGRPLARRCDRARPSDGRGGAERTLHHSRGPTDLRRDRGERCRGGDHLRLGRRGHSRGNDGDRLCRGGEP